jgi:hypothetical protein
MRSRQRAEREREGGRSIGQSVMAESKTRNNKRRLQNEKRIKSKTGGWLVGKRKNKEQQGSTAG